MAGLDFPFRRLRFFILERAILPLAIGPLRLLRRSWRAHGPDGRTLREMMQAPRVVLVTYHGMLLHLLAFSQLPPAHGRRLLVMLSPSRDGRLLAATLARFGIDHVFATSGSRAIGGSLEFVERVRAGEIGVVAADGPLGPCCVAKPGPLRIAAAAGADVAVATTAASRGMRFRSWDRAHLPAPFAHVALSLRMIPCPQTRADESQVADLQRVLLDGARRIKSPVLPPELRVAEGYEPAVPHDRNA